MTPGTVIIHLRYLTVHANGRSLLTPDELRRADSFRFDSDRARWITARAALRRILAETTGLPPRDVPLLTNDFGKPLLAPPFDGIHFNLSHCHDLALIATGVDGPLGIDIEPLDRAAELTACQAGFCHPLEIERLPQGDARSTALLDLWTAKEAYLKALGTGLSTTPESVCLHLAADFRIRRLHHPSLARHAAAVCVPHPVTEIRFAPDKGSTSAEVSG
jgi:4'-phosphopantetheinyl transferase